MRKALFPLSLLLAVLCCSGCIKPKITLFPDATEPLREFTIQGDGKGKILVVTIKGFISDSAGSLPWKRRSNTVREVVSQLKHAEKDKDVKAVVLKVDSHGGSVTASDMLYHEIVRYKERSGVKLVVVLMSVAASGGYYVSLPADFILAHPTTITGSIGVVFLRPNVSGLLGKAGIEVNVDKSGRNKDMGSPFRKATVEEQQIVQGVIDDMAGRFINLVSTHRKLGEAAKADISSARIYTAADALRLGLVDRIGYLDDALAKAGILAGLPDNPKVVVYRRAEYPDDNLYNTAANKPATPEIHLFELGLAEALPPLDSGLYYLWMPAGAD
ncbi:MAG: signal peptide peptidase SppA [Syntrophobacteraceae bacterium]|nr:signal peptide peptidase SppA [Desulfobacteraceae bacterium]